MTHIEALLQILQLMIVNLIEDVQLQNMFSCMVDELTSSIAKMDEALQAAESEAAGRAVDKLHAEWLAALEEVKKLRGELILVGDASAEWERKYWRERERKDEGFPKMMEYMNEMGFSQDEVLRHVRKAHGPSAALRVWLRCHPEKRLKDAIDYVDSLE